MMLLYSRGVRLSRLFKKIETVFSVGTKEAVAAERPAPRRLAENPGQIKAAETADARLTAFAPRG